MSIPVILHVPYSTLYIPPVVRESIILNENQIDTELLALTDRYTEDLFALPEVAMITSPVSRMVVDMERLRDDHDGAMAAAGMGAVYERTSDGQQLRNLSPPLKEDYLTQYYDPYHSTLDKMVESFLKEHGKCLIINCHSFASKPLPFEGAQNRPRPHICLGTCNYHTPQELIDFAHNRFAGLFSVDNNYPSSGTFVPAKYYLADKRVTSLMVGVNRRLFMNEMDGEKTDLYSNIKAMLAEIISEAINLNHNPDAWEQTRLAEILARRAELELGRTTCVRCSMGKRR